MLFTYSLGTSNMPRNYFVVITGTDSEGNKRPLVGRGLALVRVQTSNPIFFCKTYAFVRFKDVTKPIYGVDDSLGWVCLRWSTNDNLGRTGPPHDRATHAAIVSLWFELINGGAVMGTVHVLRQNYPTSPF